ncbi:hypothetical protein [Paraburkholderia humisilvae]|uniref:Uncharacterized protein n=1 Tax=Paraburkholderia humisilvae TaxID=627669 RepID=A0A6J5DJJ3_9BURK|nr:hypothetical protein [Paraburkholderia humisilvae]CAB3754329.1 hypothetical protein LMG29542_02317 [Paraburkholderia humisilvae]
MSEPIDPRADMRLEELALAAFQQSGIASLTEQELASFLLKLALHTNARMVSLRGHEWTCGVLDVMKAKVLAGVRADAPQNRQ